jgi:hypothetical protein
MYEGKHAAWCLSEPGFTLHDILQMHPSAFSPHVIIPDAWVKLHCVYRSHFLDYSSVVGHLSCFHSLGILNSAVINTSIQVPPLYPDLRSLDRRPQAISLDHTAVLALAFWGISILFPTVVILICVPTNRV